MGISQENEVAVKIIADSSPLKPGMDQAANDVEKASERMRSAVANMNTAVASEMSSLTSTLGNVRGMLAGVISVLAGGSFFKSAVEETRKLTGEANGLAKALGISTTEASALNVALGDIYSSSETFIGASQQLSRQLRTNEDGLNAMGLKTRDANGDFRNLKDLMFDAISVLRGYKEGTDRMLAAQEMFGRGGAEVMSMLKLTSEAMDEARQKADELGLTVGSENVKALREYKAAMNDLDDVISAAKKAIGDELMPHLTEMADWLSKTGPDAVNTLRSQIDTLGTVAIGTVLTASIRAMSLRLADATVSLVTTTQATRQAATAKLEAAQAAARSTAAIRDHAAMLLREAEAAVASATGMARLSVVTNTLIPARERLEAATRAAAAAERQLADAATASSMTLQAAGTVINALGGPLGAIITLLGFGATAWTAFGDKAKSAVDLANDEIEKGRAALARYNREKKFGTGDEGQLRASLETVENKISILVQTSGSKAAAENLAALRKEAEALQAALNNIEAGKGQKEESGGRGYVPPPDKIKADPHKSEMPGWEASLSKDKSAFMLMNEMREMSLEDEKAYWDKKLDVLNQGDKEYGAVMKKSADLDLQILKKSAKDGQEISREKLDERKNYALNAVAIEEQSAQEMFALGKISKEELLNEEARFLEDRHQIEIAAMEVRLADLSNDAAKNAVEIEKANNQKLAMERKFQLDKRKIESQISLEKMTPQMNVFKSMETSFGQAITGMLTRAQTFRQALGSVFNALVSQGVQMGVKMLSNWIFTESAKTAATTAGVATRTATEQAGAGQSLLIQAGTAIKTILTNAYEAMAGAFKAIVGIPYIGPILAPAAAGAAFATVSGYASSIPSAEGGWDIPSGINPITQLHEDEMVLPAHIANPLRASLNNGQEGGGTGGGAVHHHYHIKAFDGQDVKRVLMKHKNSVVAALKEADRGFVR